MPTTARKTAQPKPSTAARRDAIALLKADHEKVDELFRQFEHSRTASRKKEVVEEICSELTLHAQLEEEIFYPTVKEALNDAELIPEAAVEHASIKELIAQVQGVEPDGEDYDAKVKVMSEYVKHHVKEEQDEMFPKVRKAKLDLVALGEQMASRKQELMQREAA